MARVRRGWRVDELQCQPPGGLAPGRALYWACAARHPSRRPSDRAIEPVRTGDQSQDRQDAWDCGAAKSRGARRRGDRVKRREFFMGVVGMATASRLAAHAQQSVRSVGYVSSRSAQADTQLVAAFRRGLAEIGYSEGQNVVIQFRWAEGDYGRHEALTADLVQQQVEVIVAT